ncbi:MAG: hypothetical protein WBO70_08255, partial [Erysipelotrichaceae bacterium]
PYIEKDGLFYKISNEDELRNILGDKYFGLVEDRIVVANEEIEKTNIDRDAVHDIHIAIMEANGNTVEALWWGKKIKTYGRTNAINTRDIMSGFSQTASDAGLLAALTVARIGFIPGYGTAATVARIAVGLISWADEATWSKASGAIAKQIDIREYYITIDINAWNMDVQVYAS